MTVRQLNDLNLGTLRDQLGNQLNGQLANQLTDTLTNQAENLRSSWRDVAQTARSRNPLPLSQQRKEQVGGALLVFCVTSALTVFAFLFYRAIVKSGVKAALREHHDEMMRERSHRDNSNATDDSETKDPID